MNSLEQSIHKTLVYFDLLNFPLTSEELFRYLWIPRVSDEKASVLGYGEFIKQLEIISKDRVAVTGEHYHLIGREALVAIRKQAVVETEIKMKKAFRAVKLIRSVPFLRAVFVCNSVGAGMAKPESDIDFFIVTEKNRIWIVRFFTNLILRIFGIRTYGAHQRDRICLSFYVDSAHLDLSPWRVADDDIHFAYWLTMMKPLYDTENYFGKFLIANRWVEKFIPNIWSKSKPSYFKLISNGKLGRIWKRAWEAMWRGAYGDVIENEAKKLQLTKMKFSLKEKAKQADHGVVMADGILKFHENDTRLAIRKKWLEKVRSLG